MDTGISSSAIDALRADSVGKVGEGVPEGSGTPDIRLVGKNGYADASHVPVAQGPRAKRRERWVDLPADSDYEGFKFRMWVNFPQTYQLALTSNDEEKIEEALTVIILEHNGWLDTDGKPYPLAGTSEFWKAIPNELLQTMLVLVSQETGKLPLSVVEKARNTRRG